MPKSEDLVIHVRTEGAEEATAELERIVELRKELLRLEDTFALERGDVWELAFQVGGAATGPLLADHPDYTFPAERVGSHIREVLERRGYGPPPDGYADLAPAPEEKKPEAPELSVLVALGSIAVHLEEYLETHEEADLIAAKGALATPGLEEWREEMGALLPLKRT